MPARKPKKARSKARRRRPARAKAAHEPRTTSRATSRAKRAAARPKKIAKVARKAAARATTPGPAKATPPKPARAAQPKASPAPNAIGLRIQHLDYTTHDLAAVRHFYGELLGLAHQTFDEQQGYLSLKTGPNSSIGFSAPSPGPPEQWRPPREPALCFIVENVDEAHRALVAKGVTFEQPPTNLFWDRPVCWTRDPEGRIVYLVQRTTD